MTLIGGLTDVVGVIGRLGDEVVILEVLALDAELVMALDVVILDEEELVLLEPFKLLLEDKDVLEVLEDFDDICVLVCCWSCCLHFALRFLNHTC